MLDNTVVNVALPSIRKDLGVGIAEASALAEEPDPQQWLPAMANVFLGLEERRVLLASLWVQALTEASDSDRIREFMRTHLREVHDFVAAVIARCQTTGAVPPERDPGA